MRTHLLTSVSATAIGLAAVSVGSSHARAFGDDWYVSVFGGASTGDVVETIYYYAYDTELETGFTFGGAIGTELYRGLRGELELSYQELDAGEANVFPGFALDLSGDYKTFFLFTNVWKDFDLGLVSPYFGGGIGVGVTDAESTCICGLRFDDTGLGFAGQLGAGLRFPVSDRIIVDIGYRFRSLVDAGLDANINTFTLLPGLANLYTHTGQIGVTYRFGDRLHTLSPANSNGLDSLWYVSVFGGASIPEDTPEDYYNYTYIDRAETGFTVGGAVGTYVAPNLRGELEVAYSRHAYESYLPPFGGVPPLDLSGDQAQLTVLANLWKELRWGDFAPYFGGGIGAGVNFWDDVSFAGGPEINDAAVGLATQFGFGLRYAVSDRVSIDLGYRFRSIINSLIVDDPVGHSRISTYSHNVQAGVSYGLGSNAIMPAADDMASDEHEFYISVFGGAALLEESVLTSYGYTYEIGLEDGFTVGLAFGSEIVGGLRGELEVSYVENDGDEVGFFAFLPPTGLDGKVQQLFVLSNLWKDFQLPLGFSPYFGGGVGLAVVDTDLRPVASPVGADANYVAPAAQIGAGLRFGVTEGIALDFGYRFKAVLNGPIEGGAAFGGFPHGQAAFHNHIFQAGATFGF